MTDPVSSRSGKKISILSTLLFLRHGDDAWRQLLVCLENHLAGLGVDDVGRSEGTLERLVRNADRLDPRLTERGDRVRSDLLAALDREVASLDVGCGTQTQQRVRHLPRERRSLVEEDAVYRMERANDLVGTAQSERA